MTGQRHRILREILEVRVADASAAWEIQDQLSRIQRHRIEDIIDRCCTELSDSDRVHRIDLLEVDLGRLNPANLEEEIAEKLPDLLRQALARRIDQQSHKAVQRGESLEESSRLELVAFFASTGALPWWADSSRARLIDESVAFLARKAPRRLAAFIREVASNRQRLKRIVLSCRDETLLELFETVSETLLSTPQLEQRKLELIGLLQTPRIISTVTFRNALWQGVLHSVHVQEFRSARSPAFWEQALAETAQIAGMTYTALVSSLDGAGAAKPDLLVGENARNPSIEYAGSDQTEHAASDRAQFRSPSRPGDPQPSRQHKQERFKPSSIERWEVDVDLAYSGTDAYYVGNAGLVLVAPFLETFFEHQDLTAERAFKDRTAVHRAAGLLQYLVVENPSPPEFQASLNKLLCGMDLDEVLDFGPPVTEAEAEGCIEMLTAVIEHATILENISIDTFRENFLTRKGMLSSLDDSWLLRVEREPYDVRLDRLPWTFDWVKLPWMRAPLRVHW